MQPLSRERLAANPYRILGLSGSANQAAIQSAARRMRIWPDPQKIPPTPWDFPRLGPLSRAKIDIEHAVASLNEPQLRIENRLLWYFAQTPPIHPDPKASSEKDNPLDSHDLMLIYLQNAFENDPDCRQIDTWTRAMKYLARLANSRGIIERQLRIEKEGSFEKVALEEEITSATRSLPNALASCLIPKALSALGKQDYAACAQIASILLLTGSNNESDPHLRRLLDSMEDALDGLCKEMDFDLRDNLRTDHNMPMPYYPANLRHSTKAWDFYDERIRPSLESFCPLAKDDNDRLVRVRGRCARVLALLGLGWEWSGRFVWAEKTLLEAQELARGTAETTAIVVALNRCRPLADQERLEAQWKHWTDQQRILTLSYPPDWKPQMGNPRMMPEHVLSAVDWGTDTRLEVMIFEKVSSIQIAQHNIISLLRNLEISVVMGTARPSTLDGAECTTYSVDGNSISNKYFGTAHIFQWKHIYYCIVLLAPQYRAQSSSLPFNQILSRIRVKQKDRRKQTIARRPWRWTDAINSPAKTVPILAAMIFGIVFIGSIVLAFWDRDSTEQPHMRNPAKPEPPPDRTNPDEIILPLQSNPKPPDHKIDPMDPTGEINREP